MILTSAIIVKEMLLLLVLHLQITNAVDDNIDKFNINIVYRLANCSSSAGDISVGMLYREEKNPEHMSQSTISNILDDPNPAIKTLDSTELYSNSKSRCRVNQKNDWTRCRYSFSVSGLNDTDHIRKFAFRLLTPSLSAQDNYTCCWSFDKFVINRQRLGYTCEKILRFKDDFYCVKQPSSTEHVYSNNIEWVCPRNSNEVVFESGIFTANYSSDSVKYASPEECDDGRQQNEEQITCPTHNNGTSDAQSSVGTNATLTGVKECYNGTAKATKFCSTNGESSNVHCTNGSSVFNKILIKIVAQPVEGLFALLTARLELSLSQYVLLLDKSLESASHPSCANNINNERFVEVFYKVTNDLITLLKKDNITNETIRAEKRTVLSQLLQSLDKFALTFIEPSEDVVEHFSLKVKKIEPMSVTTSDGVNGIQVGSNSITLPNIIFEDVSLPVHIASFFFPNQSHLLPPLDTNGSIISPIISATIDCDSCNVKNLTEDVQITLQIEKCFSNKQVSCVFYDFNENQDGLLANGDWNTSGCTTVSVNCDIVTCSCNHLTHFAILLSPGGPEISSIHYHVLNTMGLVLVPISLLCMVLVILTYTLIRSLWSIRNYIHIMLCGSLFMAQLVFIIGVDKVENQGVCSAVAVILLYLFLVTFMWMLMEGVVLYVTLVRVFIENHLYYIIAFTVISYLIPAIYMAIITPIGFLINTEEMTHNTHFYYKNEGSHSSLFACWLNYSTGFIWSFIAPVIVIIMLNIGFFIMCVVIMRKHIKRQKKMLTAEIKHWLKSSISLTLVMGIAWLVGLMAFRKELLPVVYIITIFIAAQGILIFIILVPMSEQVRDAYLKLWNAKFQSTCYFPKNINKKNVPLSGRIVLGTFDPPVVENSVIATAQDNRTFGTMTYEHAVEVGVN